MKKIILTLLIYSFFIVPAQALEVTHDFVVRLGVFDASRTNFTYQLSPKTYNVHALVRTHGMFDTLYPFKAHYETTGNIKKENFETTNYKYKSQSRFNQRRKELIYNDKGEPIYRISSKNDKQKKVAIDQKLNQKDTTDLQTVIAKLAYQYNRLKFCDARMQVFDGKHRFDVIFKDEGQDTIAQSPNRPFSGSAAKCSMYIDKLGEKGDDLLWELTQDRPIYFWIMRDPKTQAPFIAQIKITDTPLGELEVYTQKITVKD